MGEGVGCAGAQDIQLVAFGDLVQLARVGHVDKRPELTRTVRTRQDKTRQEKTRQDKSFGALDLPTLQGEVGLQNPTKVNIFEHFTPKFTSYPSAYHHGKKQRTKFARLEKIRKSRQKSSYKSRRRTNLLSKVSQNNKQLPQISQQQLSLSFNQQSQYWASQSKSSILTDSTSRQFKLGDIGTFSPKKRGQEKGAPANILKQRDQEVEDYYDYETITGKPKMNVATEENSLSFNNYEDLDQSVEAVENDVYLYDYQNDATITDRKPTTQPTRGTSNILRQNVPKPIVAKKARQPIERKTYNVPITVNIPVSIPDLSFVNSLYNPNRARKPAQRRTNPKPVINEVAKAKERCIDKVEDVEEIVFEEVEECTHSYDKKCHTSYVTEYESQQEEECSETFNKKCEITFQEQARNETVEVCMNPLVKDCNLVGREFCKTEYITECFTLNNAKIVVDDIPSCKTVYDEKCEIKQSGYSTKEECKSWPKQVCSVAQQIKKKFDPQTKCEKVPQEICGPSGCGFVPGPEECYDKTMTIVANLPLETCFLNPIRNCKIGDND